MTPTNLHEEVNRLRARYLDAFALGDTGICTLATASYLLDLPYQELRDRMVYEYNLRTPLDLLAPKTVSGSSVVSSYMTNEFWRRVLGLPEVDIPRGKKPLFDVQGWPVCVKWKEKELEGWSGAAIVYQQSSGFLHMTPVVESWSLDHFGLTARGIPVLLSRPRRPDLEVVYAQPIELR